MINEAQRGTATPDMQEWITPKKSRVREIKLSNIKEDLELYKKGVLDLRSILVGYRKLGNPVGIEVCSPADPNDLRVGPDGRYLNRIVKTKRYTHNLRTNNGVDWQSALMGGDIASTNTNTGLGTTGQATASSATTLTAATTTAPSASEYVGRWIVATVSATVAVYGVILSHTTTTTPVFTVDQWYLVGSTTGAAGSTPSSTATYLILPGRTPHFWMALSTGGAQAATDTSLPGEVAGSGGTAGLGRALGTFAHTFGGPAAGNASYTMAHTWTLTGAGPSTLTSAAMLNAQNAGIDIFENTFTSATLQTNDQLTLTWTVNI